MDNLLDSYLKENSRTRTQMVQTTNMPESTMRSLTKKPFAKWTMVQIDAIAKTVGKDSVSVVKDLVQLNDKLESESRD
jgi:hypothetical protein